MRTLTAVGQSLWPFVRENSELLIDEGAESFRRGDLVVYCGEHLRVCHRILFRKKSDGVEWFYLKGDGRFIPDGWIPSYRLLGRVVSINGKSVRSGLEVWKQRGAFAHSVIQALFFEAVFRSSFGQLMSKWRAQYLSLRPVGLRPLTLLTAPWRILKLAEVR